MENSFDARALTWDENPSRTMLARKASEVIFREMPLGNNHRILDYGCGTGLLGYSLIDHVGEVVFCDTSEGMLAQVERKRALAGYANVTIVKAGLLHDDIPGEFDYIFSMLVLHHVEAIEKMVSRIAEKLKPGGVFCWIDLDREDGSFHGDSSVPHFGFAKDIAGNVLRASGLDPLFYTNELYIDKEIESELIQFPIFVFAARKG
jgi:tRNA (cmo5U34)-methyltransferase